MSVDTEIMIGDVMASPDASFLPPMALLPTADVEPLTDAELVCLSVFTSNRREELAAFLSHLATIKKTYWQPITPFQEAAARVLVEHQIVGINADLPAFELTAIGRERIASTIPLRKGDDH